MVRLPNLVVVGAPKCGTTSLYQYLKQHPEVYLPTRKELHYFTRAELARDTAGPGDATVLQHLCADRAAYEAEFAPAAGQPIRGDISPSYFDFAEVAPAMRRELGDARIVVLLRDPIGKAFSQYMHLVRDGRETLPFFEALQAEPDRTGQGWGMIWRYAGSSLYAERLRHYRDAFGSDRVRIYRFEDFIADPQATLSDLWRWLGIDPSVRPDTSRAFNASSQPRSRVVASLISKRSPLAALARALVPAGVRGRITEGVRNLNAGAKGRVDERSAAYLREFFRDDVRETETLFGRPLGWLR
ncbi:MAG TPA: sulfotransferase [Gemmatimonadales bacterium]|nr:sulfotransferase [Gemmatimonadales bacterium]